MPLALTDQQLSLVTQAASLIAPAARDAFLRSVASVLGSSEHPSDSAVIRALRFVLAERGVAVGERYFTETRNRGGDRGGEGSLAASAGRHRA
jgi:hypothetical protein